MPAVGELSVVSVLVQPSEEDLVRVAVLQVDQFAQSCQEGGVAVGAVLVGQYGDLIVDLKRTDRVRDGSEIRAAPPGADIWSIHWPHLTSAHEHNTDLVGVVRRHLVQNLHSAVDHLPQGV